MDGDFGRPEPHQHLWSSSYIVARPRRATLCAGREAAQPPNDRATGWRLPAGLLPLWRTPDAIGRCQLPVWVAILPALTRTST